MTQAFPKKSTNNASYQNIWNNNLIFILKKIYIYQRLT